MWIVYWEKWVARPGALHFNNSLNCSSVAFRLAFLTMERSAILSYRFVWISRCFSGSCNNCMIDPIWWPSRGMQLQYTRQHPTIQKNHTIFRLYSRKIICFLLRKIKIIVQVEIIFIMEISSVISIISVLIYTSILCLRLGFFVWCSKYAYETNSVFVQNKNHCTRLLRQIVGQSERDCNSIPHSRAIISLITI